MKQNNTLLIPIIGGFSSGKSSLLNALIGQALLSTDLTPETALATELRAGKKRCYQACLPAGSCQDINEANYQAGDFAQLSQQGGYLALTLPELKAWPQLVFVDLPGWSSGDAKHEQHIHAYLQHMAQTQLDTHTLFILAISIEDGTLKDNVREQLEHMDWAVSDYLLVFTKADKRNDDDRDSVCRHISQLVRTCTGKAPRQSFVTSARKKQLNGLPDFLQSLQDEIAQEDKPNLSALRQEIAHMLSAISNAEEDNSSNARDIGDDIWDLLSDDLMDEYFDELPYEVCETRGKALIRDVEQRYRQRLERCIKQAMPQPSSSLLDGLRKISMSLPEPDPSWLGNGLGRTFQKVVMDAVREGKPGAFSSKDYAAVGKRVRSGFRSRRSEFRNDIIGCAVEDLPRYWQHYRNSLQRLHDMLPV